MKVNTYHFSDVFKRGHLKQTLNHTLQFKETYEIYILNQFVVGIYLVDDIIY